MTRCVALRPVLASELAPTLQRVFAKPRTQIVNRCFQIVLSALALADEGKKIAAACWAKLFRPNAKKPV